MGVVFKGDHEPLKLYKGDTLVQNPLTVKKSGTEVTFEKSYNHAAEVEVAGKSEQVQLSGKNLMPNSLPKNAQHMVMNSSTIGSASNAYVFALPCELNSDYFVSASSTGASITIGFGDSAEPRVGDTVDYKGSMVNRTGFAVNSGANGYMLIGVSSVDKYDEAVNVFNVQLERGSTATEYEPYCGGIPSPNPEYPQEIKSIDRVTLVSMGRNILPFPFKWRYPTNPYTTGGVTYTDNGDGSISIKGTATGSTYFNLDFDTDIRRYRGMTISKNITERVDVGTGYGFTVGCFKENGTYNSFLSRSSSSATIPDDATLLRCYLSVSTGYTVDTVVRPQIELGQTIHPYEPYHSTTRTIDLSENPIRSLPDGTEDRLTVYRDGMVQLAQMVGMFEVASKSINWQKSGSYPGGYYTNRLNIDTNAKNRPGIAGMCSHLRGVALIGDYDVGTFFIDGSFNFRVGNDVASTVDEFKQWVADNKPVIQYPFATPVAIDIPPIDPIPTYYPTTVVYDQDGNDITARVLIVDE